MKPKLDNPHSLVKNREIAKLRERIRLLEHQNALLKKAGLLSANADASSGAQGRDSHCKAYRWRSHGLQAPVRRDRPKRCPH
jgi:hypothetical protein